MNAPEAPGYFSVEAFEHVLAHKRSTGGWLANAVVTGGFGLMELRPAHLSLEEIFLQLTTSDTTAEAA